MPLSRSKADAIIETWLRDHARAESIVGRPLETYFEQQSKRIVRLIVREKITTPAEWNAAFGPAEKSKETEKLVNLLTEKLLPGVCAIGANRFLKSRPKEQKAINFPRLPAAIKKAIRGFMAELRSKAWWVGIVGVTSEAVQESIEESLDKGRDLRGIAKAVEAALEDHSKINVAALSVTESTSALGAGQYHAARETADQTDIELLQEWVGLLDDSIRESHRKATGQQISANDPDARFIIGNNERARWPADVLLSPRERIGCRCTTVVVFPEEVEN